MINTVLVIAFLAYYADAEVQFDLTNHESGLVWIGIQGGSGQPHLSEGGLALDAGQTVTVSAPDNWSGRFWARTYCDTGSNTCQTGDCGNGLKCNGAGGKPPVTLIEITLKGAQGLDYYDVSLVDGFNVMAFIEPVDGDGPSGQYSCTKDACMADINANCPADLKVEYNGQTIACNSACNKYNTDQYCCRGAYGTPETCKSSEWPTNYPAFFKEQCPDAYSYAYDDHKSTFTCKASHYRIQIGGS